MRYELRSAESQIAAENANPGFITLAVVIKTQGRRGEVAAELHTSVPERFHEGMQLWALSKNDERRQVRLEEFWPHKEFLVFKFEGIESISDAETLVGAEIQVPRSARAELESGWTYLSDLVGCTVFDGDREIGPIRDVQFGAGEAPLLVVEGRAKLPYEIPFAEAYLERVDGARKQVRMHLPEGLLDVNAPLKKEEKGTG
jgi:16S rRNA processing protein RimM